MILLVYAVIIRALMIEDGGWGYNEGQNHKSLGYLSIGRTLA